MSVAMTPAQLSKTAVQTTKAALEKASPGFGTQFMAYLEQNPIADMLFKDVTGYNLPRLATVRTGNEFWDTLTGELSNTGITLGGTLLLPQLFQKLLARLANMPVNTLKKEITNPDTIALATKTARLGSAFGYLTLWASLYWAAPFFRNWLTLVHSKTSDFEGMVGLDKRAKATSASPEKLREKKRFQLKGMLQVLAVGATLSAASALGFGLAARKMAQSGGKALNGSAAKLVNNLFKRFDLQGPQGNQVAPGMATLLFWSLPAYFGWLQASRSPNEFKENLLKTVNSNLWFFCMTPLVKRSFLKQFKDIDPSLTKVPDFKEIMAVADEPLRQKLLSLKQKNFGMGLAITVTMLALTPQIINRILTKRRFEKAQRLSMDTQNNHKASSHGRYSAPQSLIVSKNTLPFEFFLLNNR
jgi:hypothetical protein